MWKLIEVPLIFHQILKMIEHNFINNEMSDTGSIEPLVHFSSNFNAVFLQNDHLYGCR